MLVFAPAVTIGIVALRSFTPVATPRVVVNDTSARVPVVVLANTACTRSQEAKHDAGPGGGRGRLLGFAERGAAGWGGDEPGESTGRLLGPSR
jgi:hypothetical protein